MKRLLASILCAALAGCSTTIYSRTGKPLLRTYADMSTSQFTYQGGGESISWTATGINHSHPTAIALHGATSMIASAGLAVATGATGLAALRGVSTASSVLPSAIPVVGSGATLFRPQPSPAPITHP